jgi:hypothetical protein
LFTYAVFAHDKPNAVLRLAHTILGEVPESRVVVHYSASSGSFPKCSDARITSVENPAAVQYARYSMTDMMLRTFQQIRRDRFPNEWIINLSGQCYPVKPLEDLQRMLANSQADAILRNDRITRRDSKLHERYAFSYRVLRERPLPFPLNVRQVRGLVNRAQPFVRLKSMPRLSLVGFRAERTIYDLVPDVYHGTQWSVLSGTAADRLMQILEDDPELISVYQKSLCSDESLIATVLLNAPDLRVANSDVTFADWSGVKSSSPRTLSTKDLPAIERSGKWFARKIEPREHDGLRDALDELRARRQRLLT